RRMEYYPTPALPKNILQNQRRRRNHIRAIRPEMKLVDALLNGKCLQLSGNGCEFVGCDLRRTALLEECPANIPDGFDAAAGSNTHFNFLAAQFLLQSPVRQVDVS